MNAVGSVSCGNNVRLDAYWHRFLAGGRRTANT
jgi:hypothetical protein